MLLISFILLVHFFITCFSLQHFHYTLFFFYGQLIKKHLKSGLPFQMLFVFMTDPMITDY